MAPINTLYPEILAVVFEYVIDMEIPQSFVPRMFRRPTFASSSPDLHTYKQPPAVYVLSAVCQRWRDVTNAFPRLWSSIRQVSFRENQWLDLNLERSKAVPLKIFVQYEMPTRKMKPSTMELLGRLVPWHVERIQELHLSSIQLATSPFVNTTLPNLECHTLKDIPDFPPGSPPIFNSQTPRLKQLTLHACPFFPNHTFNALTHLCLASGHASTSAWPLNSFLDVLRASPEMEELYVAQSTFTTASRLGLERPKVHLSRLRLLSIGRYQDSLSELLDMLIIPHPIKFLAWGTGAFHGLLDLLRTFLPAQLGESKLVELRVSSIIAPYHPSSIFPRRGYTIISNGDRLQIDGRLEPHNFLLAAPKYIDVSNVTQLWLGVRFQEDPSLEEWQSFFRTVPLVVTLVISHRSSFQILFALTLNPKEENQSRDLSLPELETIRVFADRNLSVQILSQFAQQRARLGKRLRVCEIIAKGKQRGARWGKRSDAAAVPASAPRTPDGLVGLTEFIDDVDCSKVVTDSRFEVIETPALCWVDRLWLAE
ncbi:hypothetical protein BDN71DRAFT_1448862 [Pleurotus eryngii]|uniref:F-box domain-containing protein n=1 Tax=Pleurotus eryngii TaxID=5323 RepID=A0A9P6DG25_PLEER|nr:hypothetical protein BDN71DRAFT_1448862 [Pleurotus eryngii]